MRFEDTRERVILIPVAVPTLDHRPRRQEFLKGEVAELEELDQPAILDIVASHHQQTTAIFDPMDEFIDGALDVAELCGQTLARFLQQRSQSWTTNLLHTIEHHCGGDVTELRKSFFFGNRFVALSVPG